MKSGRFLYNQVQRTIIRPVRTVQGLEEGFRENYDCAAVHDGDDGVIVASAVSLVLRYPMTVELPFYRACNQIYAQKAQLYMVNASFVWPEDTEEQITAQTVKALTELCRKEKAVLGAVTASASAEVKNPVVSIQAVGKRTGHNSAPVCPGLAVAAAGHAGMTGTGYMAVCADKALTERYTPGFIGTAAGFLDGMSLKKIAEICGDDAVRIYPIAEGGVLAALWNFADGAETGLDIDQKKIPIRQETVEICEFYGVNPYTLAGDGACFIVTANPEAVLQRLENAGVKCALAGSLTGEKARILRRDDEVRYLDKPAQDEFEVWLNRPERNGVL